MKISIACKGLSRVIDNLFANLTEEYVLNLDNLVVYSASIFVLQAHLR